MPAGAADLARQHGPRPTALLLLDAAHLAALVLSRASPIGPQAHVPVVQVARHHIIHVLVHGSPAGPLQHYHDNGGEFTSEEVAKLLEERYIAHRTTSANHPQGNGLTERAVQTVKTLLTACINDPALESDWEDHLSSITLAYNATPQASTGFAPYTLMAAPSACRQPEPKQHSGCPWAASRPTSTPLSRTICAASPSCAQRCPWRWARCRSRSSGRRIAMVPTSPLRGVTMTMGSAFCSITRAYEVPLRFPCAPSVALWCGGVWVGECVRACGVGGDAAGGSRSPAR